MSLLYQRIKQLRLQLKLSQEELAYKTGYSDRSSIAKIEKGEVDLAVSKITAFATALGVSPLYLMGWTDDEHYTINKSAQPQDVYTPAEHTHLKKYRKLPPPGKQTVDTLVDNLLLMNGAELQEKEQPPVALENA